MNFPYSVKFTFTENHEIYTMEKKFKYVKQKRLKRYSILLSENLDKTVKKGKLNNNEQVWFNM